MWHEHGVTEDMFLAGLPTPPLQALLKAWVAHSREYFDRGLPLLEYVPKWFAVDVNLFVRGGRETLHQIERSHFDVWTCRPTVSKWKKVQLLIQSLFDWKCNKKQPHNGVVTERFSDA
jgi:phytoene/squalene synthetase